ncbi:MAG TPA: hypothetical protein PKC21_03975 [Oligoflexia bacterium]|nr:hypothetical protein [Oligoflexia bacterium]HMR24496.1 hypothetical protein [Oligoflexia bacterium]
MQKHLIVLVWAVLGLYACGGGESDTINPPDNKFAQKIDYFPTIDELEVNGQSLISFTFSTQMGEEIIIDINGMASCSSNDVSCTILVNNGENDLHASGDFSNWTGGLAFVQCEAIDNPECTINLENSGNYAVGLST